MNKKPLTFHHFEQRALLQALDGLELSKVVQHVSVQLQGEAGAVAGVLPVHQHLMDLLYHFLGRHLMEEREGDEEKHNLRFITCFGSAELTLVSNLRENIAYIFFNVHTALFRPKTALNQYRFHLI